MNLRLTRRWERSFRGWSLHTVPRQNDVLPGSISPLEHRFHRRRACVGPKPFKNNPKSGKNVEIAFASPPQYPHVRANIKYTRVRHVAQNLHHFQTLGQRATRHTHHCLGRNALRSTSPVAATCCCAPAPPAWSLHRFITRTEHRVRMWPRRYRVVAARPAACNRACTVHCTAGSFSTAGGVCFWPPPWPAHDFEGMYTRSQHK